MDTSGFYTTNEQGELMHAPNYVIAPDFAIYRDQREAYTYPVHGWSWFDSEAEARAAYNLPPVAGELGGLLAQETQLESELNTLMQ